MPKGSFEGTGPPVATDDQGETVGDLAQPNRSALKAFPLGRSKRKGPSRNVLGEYAAPTVATECELEHGTPRGRRQANPDRRAPGKTATPSGEAQAPTPAVA
jgi:hypothetical protein